MAKGKTITTIAFHSITPQYIQNCVHIHAHIHTTRTHYKKRHPNTELRQKMAKQFFVAVHKTTIVFWVVVTANESVWSYTYYKYAQYTLVRLVFLLDRIGRKHMEGFEIKISFEIEETSDWEEGGRKWNGREGLIDKTDYIWKQKKRCVVTPANNKNKH